MSKRLDYKPSDSCVRESSAARSADLDYNTHAHTCEMKAPWSDPGLRELLALAALAAFGCGLAFAQADLLFAVIFAAASAIAIVEALRRFR